MTNNEKRGKFIAELRREKGLTQQQLGDLINYTDKAISKWERGETTINPDAMNNLSTILGVSVSELSYGERKREENEKQIQENMEEEYQNGYHKYRKNLTTLIISFLVVIILGLTIIYFVFIRNSIAVYSIMIDNENIKEENATLIISNKLSILNFNKLISKNDEVIDSIRIYYTDKSNNEIELFSGGNDNYYIEEKNGYLEYNLKNIPKGKLYIEVNYENKESETLKLELQRRFINDNIFPKKVENINDGTKPISKSNDKLKEKLLSLGFEYLDEEYIYKINDNVNCYVNLDINRLKIIIVRNGIKEELISYIGNNEIHYEEQKNGTLLEKNYNDNQQKKDCNKEKCLSIEDYVMYLNYLKEELQ